MKNLPYILVTAYFVLVVISIIPIFTGQDAMSGILAYILTMPWSWLIAKVLPGTSTLVGVVTIIIGALINASIIGSIARWIVKR